MAGASQYPKGRAKREEILTVTLAAFARGEGGTATLADIAKAAGVTRSTLLYHFNSREELLAELIRWRDQLDIERSPSDEGLLPGYVRLARHNAGIPGLVHLFTTLSAEATTDGHAAHQYFSERYASLLTKLANEIRAEQEAGVILDSVDPAVLARIYVAVMDGMQLQWLYDKSADIEAAIKAMLALITSPNSPPWSNTRPESTP